MIHRWLVSAVLAFMAVAPVSAAITFTRLSEEVYTVHHVVKGFGSRAKAMRMVYVKAASVCVAAGYEYYAIEDQVADPIRMWDDANATVRIRLHREEGPDHVSCAEHAEPGYVGEARAKLRKRGQGGLHPATVAALERAEAAEETAGAEAADAAREEDAADPDTSAVASAPENDAQQSGAPAGEDPTCTVDQIVAMARAGLDDDQIAAACEQPEGESE